MEHLQIPVGGYSFSALAEGPPDGRLVVLLHGFPQSSAQWRHQLSALGDAGYRAVAPDQRGYSAGARPEGEERYRVNHLVADVLGMVDEMGGHRFDVVGHDWGAGVAWHLAARYPERLRTLAAVSVPHPAALMAAMAGGEQAARSAYIAFFRQEGIAEKTLMAKDGAALRGLLTTSGLPEAYAEQYVAAMRPEGALTAALNWYRAATPDDAFALGTVGVPTLFVWSDKDVAIGREAAEACAKHVEGPYRFETLAGVSHWIPEEAPDDLNRLLLEHLSAWD